MVDMEELSEAQEAEVTTEGDFSEIQIPRTDGDFGLRSSAFPDALTEAWGSGQGSPISVFAARDPDEEDEEEEDIDFFADDEEEDDDFEEDEDFEDEFDDEEEEEEELEDDDF